MLILLVSINGVLRMYPSREWDTSFAGRYFGSMNGVLRMYPGRELELKTGSHVYSFVVVLFIVSLGRGV